MVWDRIERRSTRELQTERENLRERMTEEETEEEKMREESDREWGWEEGNRYDDDVEGNRERSKVRRDSLSWPRMQK